MKNTKVPNSTGVWFENIYFSLDSKDERKRIDQLWAIEVEDRLNAYEKGEIEAIPASEVFQKINLLRT